jgi:hypothetical protein
MHETLPAKKVRFSLDFSSDREPSHRAKSHTYLNGRAGIF